MLNAESCNRWVRTLERQIETLGWSRANRVLTDPTKNRPGLHRVPCEAKSEEERREIRTARLLDGLAWSFEELANGKPVFAFRGLLLVREDAAHIGFNPVTKDASIDLQNAIEDAIAHK